MAETTQAEELKRYLFLEMSEDDRNALEERFFEDTDYFYDMLELENSIVDGYVRGTLPEKDSERFAQTLQKLPERREKVATARALQKYIKREKKIPPPPAPATVWERLSSFLTPSRFQYAFGALAVLLLCTTVLLLYQNRRARQELAALQDKRQTEIAEKERFLQEQINELGRLKQQAEGDRGQNEILSERIDEIEKQNERLEQELKALRRNNKSPGDGSNKPELPSRPVIASFFLLPGGGRGTRQNNLTLRPNVTRLNFSLQIPDDSKAVTFSAKLDGRSLGENLKPRALPSGRRVLRVGVPARELPPGDHQIIVTGNDGFEDNYTFVLQKP